MYPLWNKISKNDQDISTGRIFLYHFDFYCLFPHCLMRKASCCKFIIYRVAVNTWQQLSFCCIYILQPDTFNIYNTTKDFFRKFFHKLMILTYYLTNRMMYTYLYTCIDKRGPVKILNKSNSTILKKSCTLCKMILELFLI